MKIITRYFTTEFIKYFFSCLIIFTFLYLVIDFIQKIDDFSEAEAKAGLIFLYFIYKIPRIIVEMMPVAALISGIVMTCLMKRSNEIMAMRASGLDIIRLSTTVLVLSLFLVAVSFLISEMVVPYTSSQGNRIWKIEVEGQDPAQFYGSGAIWYKSSRSIYWIRHFDGQKKIMRKPSFYFFDDQFTLKKRIHGINGTWQDGAWIIEDGMIQELQPDGNYDLKKFDKLRLDITETPEVFIRGVKTPDDMSIFELRNFTEKLLKEGYDNTRYLVEFHIKMSFPFISLVLVLTGIPIALSINKGGIPLAVATGVALCLLYIISFGFSRSLGLAGILPPIFSAWSSNLIFLLFGIYLTMNIKR